MKKKPTFETGELLEIVWRDSNTYSYWIEEASIAQGDSDMKIASVGYYICSDDINLSVAADRCVDEHCPTINRIMTIPIGCIISIRKIKKDK